MSANGRGKWVREMPQRAGRYRVADRDGHDAGTVFVFASTDGTLRVAPIGKQWRGWWWSEPVDDLPPPPPWEEVQS